MSSAASSPPSAPSAASTTGGSGSLAFHPVPLCTKRNQNERGRLALLVSLPGIPLNQGRKQSKKKETRPKSEQSCRRQCRKDAVKTSNTRQEQASSRVQNPFWRWGGSAVKRWCGEDVTSKQNDIETKKEANTRSKTHLSNKMTTTRDKEANTGYKAYIKTQQQDYVMYEIHSTPWDCRRQHR